MDIARVLPPCSLHTWPCWNSTNYPSGKSTKLHEHWQQAPPPPPLLLLRPYPQNIGVLPPWGDCDRSSKSVDEVPASLLYFICWKSLHPRACIRSASELPHLIERSKLDLRVAICVVIMAGQKNGERDSACLFRALYPEQLRSNRSVMGTSFLLRGFECKCSGRTQYLSYF